MGEGVAVPTCRLRGVGGGGGRGRGRASAGLPVASTSPPLQPAPSAGWSWVPRCGPSSCLQPVLPSLGAHCGPMSHCHHCCCHHRPQESLGPEKPLGGQSVPAALPASLSDPPSTNKSKGPWILTADRTLPLLVPHPPLGPCRSLWQGHTSFRSWPSSLLLSPQVPAQTPAPYTTFLRSNGHSALSFPSLLSFTALIAAGSCPAYGLVGLFMVCLPDANQGGDPACLVPVGPPAQRMVCAQRKVVDDGRIRAWEDTHGEWPSAGG